METEQMQQAIDILKILVMSGIIGNFMSLFVSAVVAASWPARAKEVIVVITCIGASAFGVVITGIDYTNLVIVIPALIAGCIGSYHLWWKPTGIAPWFEKLLINDKNAA